MQSCATGTRSSRPWTGSGAIRQRPALCSPSMPRSFSHRPVVSVAASDRRDAGVDIDSYLNELNSEVKDVAAQLKDARAAFFKNQGNQKLWDMVQNIEKEKARLDMMRHNVVTSLPGTAASPGPSAETLQELLAFAKAVLGADPDDDFIMMSTLQSTVVPSALGKSLMVRPCYRSIVDLIFETDDKRGVGTHRRRFGMVVTGTPGIGKSSLALYLICCLAHRRQKVVYRYDDQVDKETLVLLDFTDNNDIKVDRATEADRDLHRLTAVAKEHNTWLLVDGSAPRAQFSGGPRIIVMTFPNADKYSEFVKGSGADTRWLPVWSLEELEKCRAVLYPLVPPDVVKERYTQFGGVVRSVLEKDSYSFEELLQGLSRESAHRLLHLDMEDARSDVRHSLAHAQVTEEFKFMHYALGSPEILEAVATKAQYSTRRFMDELMLADTAQPCGSGLGVVLGSMYERYVHLITPQGWHLDPSTFRRLQPKPDQAPAIEPPRFTAEQLSDALARKWEAAWDDDEDLATTEGYLKPRAPNQAGYDAFINSKDFTIIMQITRDPGHQLNVEGIESLLKRLPSGREACVLFTLPPHPSALSKNFKYQSWTARTLIATKTVMKRGKQVDEEVFKRLVAKSKQLPALVKEVEQWCVPFPVIQSNAGKQQHQQRGQQRQEGSRPAGAGRQGRRQGGTGQQPHQQVGAGPQQAGERLA